jgi:cytochrome b6-f complex iron-sulfur subunit
VADPPDPRDPNIPADPERRDFLTRIGVGACAAACLGSGTPGDYPEGTVRFNREQKAYIIGGSGGVYALTAVCTHLGCITRFRSDENVIACPCHGSRFDLEGNVVHGPAPRPLPWLEVRPDASGVLVVDTSIVVPQGKVLRT